MANVLVAQILYLANQDTSQLGEFRDPGILEGAKELGEGVLFVFSWGSLNLGSISMGGRWRLLRLHLMFRQPGSVQFVSC